MEKWISDSRQKLLSTGRITGVVVDMRELKPLAPDVQSSMIEGQQMYANKGMQRSAVVLATTTIKMQFKRLAAESGIKDRERYLDAQTHPNWLQVAENWVQNGVEPK